MEDGVTIPLKRYPVRTELLKPFIKYFWVIDSPSDCLIDHRLLPTNNIDLILNIATPVTYIQPGGREQTVKGFHLNGLISGYRQQRQRGPIQVIGISFFPAGLFPFIKLPLAEFNNLTVELELPLKEFNRRVSEFLVEENSLEHRLRLLERELIRELDPASISPSRELSLINHFYSNCPELTIAGFCKDEGINPRKLERLFKRHVGVSPKQFQRLNRFRRVIRRLERGDHSDLAGLAYDSSYYDQTHFIKEFKLFTGSTPSRFLKESRAVVNIVNYL